MPKSNLNFCPGECAPILEFWLEPINQMQHNRVVSRAYQRNNFRPMFLDCLAQVGLLIEGKHCEDILDSTILCKLSGGGLKSF